MLKFQIIIIIFFLITTNQITANSSMFSHKSSEPVLSLSRAMVDFILEFYIANDIKFDFIIYGQTTNHINDIINEVIKELKNELLLKILYIKNIKNWNHELDQSVIILTNSTKNFYFLHKFLHNSVGGVSFLFKNLSPKRFKFLTYCEEIENSENINKIIFDFKKPITISLSDVRFFEFFMTQDMNSVNLSANLLYSANHCHFFKSKLLNTFEVKTQKWKEKLENFEHFDNFYGCLMPFVVEYEYWYIEEINLCIDCPQRTSDSKFHEALRKSKNYRGLLNEIIDIMAIQKNFTPHFTIFHDLKDTFETKNFSPNQSNVILDSIGYDFQFHHTQVFDKENYYYLIAPNDLYSNYEKLTMPFDVTTWILLLFTFGLTFGSIFGLRFSSNRIRTIIFGKGIKNPVFNALGIFFAISQHRLPREAFSRAILIIYIWFCLIIRTCYQSMMFELMTSDMRLPLPETIEDLIKYNYTILYAKPDHFLISEKIVNDRESPKDKVSDDYQYFLKNYIEVVNGKTNEKLAFFVSDRVHAKLSTSTTKSLNILKHEKFTEFTAFSFNRNNMMIEHFDKILAKFYSMGITKHQIEYQKWLQNRPVPVEVDDPRKVLSMSDLGFYFVIWLPCLFICFVVFIFEIIGLWMKRQLKKLIGLVNILRILRRIMADYHDRW